MRALLLAVAVLAAVACADPAVGEHCVVKNTHVAPKLGFSEHRLLTADRELADTRKTHLSCVDGRNQHAILAVPGGDSGEFIAGIAALEHLLNTRLNRSLTSEQVREIFDVLSSGLTMENAERRFYMHTDIHAVDALFEALGLPIGEEAEAAEIEVDIASIPPQYWDQARVLLQQPQYVGCGHLRFAMNNPEEYRIPASLTKAFLVAFYDVLWLEVSANVSNPALRLHNDEIQLLEGEHAEQCVVIIQSESTAETGDFCRWMMPLAIPHPHANISCFLNHAQSSEFLRNEIALTMWGVMGLDEKISIDQLRTEIDYFANIQLTATLDYLARNAPVSVLNVTIERQIELVETSYLLLSIVILTIGVIVLFAAGVGFMMYHKRKLAEAQDARMLVSGEDDLYVGGGDASADNKIKLNLRDEQEDQLL